MIKLKKAQSAIEFLILVGGVLIFFIGFLFAIQSNIADKSFERRNLAVKEVAVIVQDEINLALKSTDGYRRNFELPQEIDGIDYEISFVEDFIYINTTDNRHALALPIINITGNIQKGNNMIRKNDGMIYINS